MSDVQVAIIGAGPYGLSLAAHLAAGGISHRIFGRPMQFWSRIAQAADKRFLKSYCFGTNLSAPAPGFSFADYNTPRGLETFEPCSMGNFAAYGQWFQENLVPWVEPVDVCSVHRQGSRFAVCLTNGESFLATGVIVATGLACYADTPAALASLPPSVVTHTADVRAFSSFHGRTVAVLGAGQSALEACALLHEAGARPTLLVRDRSIHWHSRVRQERSLWRRLRSPISGLGTGPKAWALTHFPGVMHKAPRGLRARFVKHHLPAEGAWWLRERFEKHVPVHLATEVIHSRASRDGVVLTLRNCTDGSRSEMLVDHVMAGSGYKVDVDRLSFLDAGLRAGIARVERSPQLNSVFESSVPGLHFVGAASAMSFGPLFRFVVGADYTARVLSKYLCARGKRLADKDPEPYSAPEADDHTEPAEDERSATALAAGR